LATSICCRDNHASRSAVGDRSALKRRRRIGMKMRNKLARHRWVFAILLVAGIHSLIARSVLGAPLADTQADYSTAAQGTNGFLYGNYHNDATDTYHNDGIGVFDTTGWTVDGNGNWDGNEGLGTPAV